MIPLDPPPFPQIKSPVKVYLDGTSNLWLQERYDHIGRTTKNTLLLTSVNDNIKECRRITQNVVIWRYLRKMLLK